MDRRPHLQPGAADEELLQNSVEMSVEAQNEGEMLYVRVTITNTAAGHHVPTDFPGRHMILTMMAADRALPLVKGQTVPDWGGAQAGQPGTACAKVLKDVETGHYPVMSYWKQDL